MTHGAGAYASVQRRASKIRAGAGYANRMVLMPLHPLTHHEIFGLVGPFARRGHHVDLAATDRAQRLLVFKTIDRPQVGPDSSAIRETLQLDNSQSHRLTRTLSRPDGLTATLAMLGADPDLLLRCVESIQPSRQFRCGPDFVIAYDYRLRWAAPEGLRWAAPEGPRSAPGVETPSVDAPAVELILTRAVARVFGVTLLLEAPTVKGEGAEIALIAGTAEATSLPRDVLAVLGRDWSPLRWLQEGSRGRLRLAGSEPGRSRHAELQFERAVAHLALTLAEAPRRFHERWFAARWRVFGRRAIPLLCCLGLVGATAALPRAHIAEHSALRMLIFNAPPLLMALFFCLREIPRVELPPVPRRSHASSWVEVRPG